MVSQIIYTFKGGPIFDFSNFRTQHISATNFGLSTIAGLTLNLREMAFFILKVWKSLEKLRIKIGKRASSRKLGKCVIFT